MKKLSLFAAALLLAFTACKKETKETNEITPADTSAVKDETPAEAAKPMDSAAMMKAWEAYATPGEPHKMLAAEVGSWKTESTMWMDPSKPPTKSTGSCELKMIMGGRYQQGSHKGNFMGMPFEGTSVVGYNNASKKWESTWMDNMGTGVMFMEGTFDDANKVATYTGTCTDPMTGQEKTYKETWTIVDDNTRKMEMFDKGPDGKEFKSMEMVMTRK
jgi:hypothetical protein